MPANDNFANAIAINDYRGSSTTNNAGTSSEGGEPIPSEGNGDGPWRSVWWKWTAPPDSVTMVFSTYGSVEAGGGDGRFDTVLAVYTGTSLANLVEVAANDDTNQPASVANNRTSYVEFTSAPGTTYYIQVSGYVATEVGDIALTWYLRDTLDEQFTGNFSDVYWGKAAWAIAPYKFLTFGVRINSGGGFANDPVGATLWEVDPLTWVPTPLSSVEVYNNGSNPSPLIDLVILHETTISFVGHVARSFPATSPSGDGYKWVSGTVNWSETAVSAGSTTVWVPSNANKMNAAFYEVAPGVFNTIEFGFFDWVTRGGGGSPSGETPWPGGALLTSTVTSDGFMKAWLNDGSALLWNPSGGTLGSTTFDTRGAGGAAIWVTEDSYWGTVNYVSPSSVSDVVAASDGFTNTNFFSYAVGAGVTDPYQGHLHIIRSHGFFGSTLVEQGLDGIVYRNWFITTDVTRLWRADSGGYVFFDLPFYGIMRIFAATPPTPVQPPLGWVLGHVHIETGAS